MGAGVRYQVSARGFADQNDAFGIDAILRSIRLYPDDRALHIVHRGRKLVVRRQPVVDREPGETGVRQHVEKRRDVHSLVAVRKTSAVDDDGRGEWTLSIG